MTSILAPSHVEELIFRDLGLADYSETWNAMKSFTIERSPGQQDECWLLQHSPVFTLGQAGLKEHIIDPHGIPVVESDRGGQVTYHGPGQLVAYLLLDIKRRKKAFDNWSISLSKVLSKYLLIFPFLPQPARAHLVSMSMMTRLLRLA